MSTQLKLSASILVAFVAVLAIILGMQALTGSRGGLGAQATSNSDALSSRDDTPELRPEKGRVLGKEGSEAVTFVEFLDFECEGCRTVYPAVEELRKRYAGRVTFVARYFPLPDHFNARRAARAVEAAAQQGKFEAMYHEMYTTQEKWGEQRVPKDALFRTYAIRLGLDMEKFDHAYSSAKTKRRIARDVSVGTALGVQGTPSFFLDGQPLEPQSFQDLTKAIDDALADQD